MLQFVPPNLPGLTLHVVHKSTAVSASWLANTLCKHAQHAVVLSLSASANRTSPQPLPMCPHQDVMQVCVQ